MEIIRSGYTNVNHCKFKNSINKSTDHILAIQSLFLYRILNELQIQCLFLTFLNVIFSGIALEISRCATDPRDDKLKAWNTRPHPKLGVGVGEDTTGTEKTMW